MRHFAHAHASIVLKALIKALTNGVAFNLIRQQRPKKRQEDIQAQPCYRNSSGNATNRRHTHLCLLFSPPLQVVAERDRFDVVDQLLRESLQWHQQALMQRRTGGANAASLLAQARDLRTQAIAADPQRETQAWDAETRRIGRALHDDLMKFYATQVPR